MRKVAIAPTRGFTLIELIAVIVILGVLLATALPKFLSLKSDAVQAAISGMEGTVRSTADMSHVKCRLTSTCNVVGSSFASFDGVSIHYWNGYPDAGDFLGVNQIDRLINQSGFTVTLAGGEHRWSHINAATPASCYVSYVPPALSGDPPVIAVVKTGC